MFYQIALFMYKAGLCSSYGWRRFRICVDSKARGSLSEWLSKWSIRSAGSRWFSHSSCWQSRFLSSPSSNSRIWIYSILQSFPWIRSTNWRWGTMGTSTHSRIVRPLYCPRNYCLYSPLSSCLYSIWTCLSLLSRIATLWSKNKRQLPMGISRPVSSPT